MSLKILRKILLCFALVVLVTGISACDNNEEGGGGGTTGETPDATVATNVGPVEKLVSTDVLNKAQSIVENVDNYLAELYGETNPFDYLLTGDSRVFFTDAISETTIDFSETLSCDSGGSKDIIGSATFTVESGHTNATLVGSFTIQYDNCQEIIELDTSTGACAITPTVTGELDTTVSVDISFGSGVTGSSDYSYYSDFDSGTDVDLDVVVGSSAADQSYSFVYELSSTSSSNNFNGLVTYAGSMYDMETLEDYIADTATTAICN